MGFPAPVGPGLAHGVADRFRREDAEFFRRVREVYLERARTHPGRYAVIGASAGEEAATERARAETSERFPHRHRTITGRWSWIDPTAAKVRIISARRATRHEQGSRWRSLPPTSGGSSGSRTTAIRLLKVDIR